ncbi:s-adenosyl-l-methionine-dependent methyltransferase [Trichococcus palustris]|uniref:S-adenosyl-l-methionine-dependent methyltransferase n=1 Tax=Trichococcus palustris TaxID=140314 RepID=A0A143YFW1_9LACT|nr:s-adenosyl-l-methionine-dependent methyltransferase [Trichococcus palustris]SFL20468.1 Putative rRNA methylase [Trichococcus palustris]
MRRLLLSALEFSHNLLKETVREGDVVIDVTVGNGNDTVLLAALVGRYGKVIGFDIQKQAIKNTKQKLLLTGLSQQVTLFHQGHEPIPEVLGNEEQIGGIIFNLGYLPGSDKSIITRKETPLQAVAA